MKRPKVLVIGASWEQAPMIRLARRMGLHVVATDPSAGADGFKFAHESRVLDPRDLSGHDRLFDEVRPDAVVADECDYSAYAASFLAARHRLPGASLDAAAITNNKALQREGARRAGVPQPEFRLCRTRAEARQAASELGLPVMIKPLDNRGSIGVIKVNGRAGFDAAYLEATAQSHSRQVIVESFVEGRTVTVEGCWAGGFHNLTFSTKRMHPLYPSNAMELRYPGELPARTVAALFAANRRLAREFGINFGLTHAEFIVKPDGGLTFIEMANRGGGVNISNLIVPAVTGFDSARHLLLSALGKSGPRPLSPTAQPKGCAVLHFFDFGAGVVRSVQGLDQVDSLPGLLARRLAFKAGDRLGDIRNALFRPGFAIVAGRDPDQRQARLDAVYRALKVTMEDR